MAPETMQISMIFCICLIQIDLFDSKIIYELFFLDQRKTFPNYRYISVAGVIKLSKKSLKILKGLSESVNRRRENTPAKYDIKYHLSTHTCFVNIIHER